MLSYSASILRFSTHHFPVTQPQHLQHISQFAEGFGSYFYNFLFLVYHYHFLLPYHHLICSSSYRLFFIFSSFNCCCRRISQSSPSSTKASSVFLCFGLHSAQSILFLLGRASSSAIAAEIIITATSSSLDQSQLLSVRFCIYMLGSG